METPELLTMMSRRKAMGLGIASGVVIAADSTESAMAKGPFEPSWGPEYKAAFDFVIQQNWKGGVGIWAVAYSEDNFAGEPFLVGTPAFRQKTQAGEMPRGWGATAGSIVVGSGTVLRLFHQVSGQEARITLLPCESIASASAMGIVDGQSNWKLYPTGDLRPPY